MLQRDKEVMESWRDSLRKVSDLSGWDCNKNRSEVELVDTVVEELWTKLHLRLPPYTEGLIGIDNKVKQLAPLLEIGSNDVRFLGIWGLGVLGRQQLLGLFLRNIIANLILVAFFTMLGQLQKEMVARFNYKVYFFQISK
ncbi:TMV resistance protein N-like [Neltuma alba]|uniref:TMV resistance protein N-like n=1 Tax=Neltuma alba TaxID=207710 RepID=UPI0010A2BA1F|nr:TMV resistance protein N-like [Prosopis alba]